MNILAGPSTNYDPWKSLVDERSIMLGGCKSLCILSAPGGGLPWRGVIIGGKWLRFFEFNGVNQKSEEMVGIFGFFSDDETPS